MAGKLDVPAPKAYLLSPNKAFRSDYAVAIEFIEGFTVFDKVAAPEKLQADLIRQFALNALIVINDTLQMNATQDHIYSYDFSEAFYFDDDLIFRVFHSNQVAGLELLRGKLHAFRRHLNIMDFDLPGLADEFHIDFSAMREGMTATAKKVIDISEAEINAMSDELMKAYPVWVAVYYEECIRAMQDRMKRKRSLKAWLAKDCST